MSDGAKRSVDGAQAAGAGTWGACARGELALAAVLGIPREALSAARALGEWAAARGDAPLAERLLAGVIALDAQEVDARLTLAAIALERGDSERALELAGEALQAGRGEQHAPHAALLFARGLAACGHRGDARVWALRLSARSDAPKVATEAHALASSLRALDAR